MCRCWHFPWKEESVKDVEKSQRIEGGKVCNQKTQNSARIQPTDRTAERKELRHKNKTYYSSSRRWYTSFRLLKMRRCMRDEYLWQFIDFIKYLKSSIQINTQKTRRRNQFVNVRMWVKCEVRLLMEWDSLAELLGKQQQQHLIWKPIH